MKFNTISTARRIISIIERNLEPERCKQLFMGREFRIKELKDKIKKLEKKVKSIHLYLCRFSDKYRSNLNYKLKKSFK